MLPPLPAGLAHYAQQSRPAAWSHADYAVREVSYPSLHGTIVLGAILAQSYPTLEAMSS